MPLSRDLGGLISMEEVHSLLAAVAGMLAELPLAVTSPLRCVIDQVTEHSGQGCLPRMVSA